MFSIVFIFYLFYYEFTILFVKYYKIWYSFPIKVTNIYVSQYLWLIIYSKIDDYY